MYIMQKQGRFVIPRTELTYPAHTLKMNEKAAVAPTDHVMPDFEDACPYEFKGEKSRAVLVEAIMLGAADRFHGIIPPKTETPEDIVHLSRLLDALELEAGWTTHVQIEA